MTTSATCFAKVFLLLVTHQVSRYHFFIFNIIAERVNLIQMSKWIENNYQHDGEQLGFYKEDMSRSIARKGEFQFIWQFTIFNMKKVDSDESSLYR